jgi:hypothetical protein
MQGEVLTAIRGTACVASVAFYDRKQEICVYQCIIIATEYTDGSADPQKRGHGRLSEKQKCTDLPENRPK